MKYRLHPNRRASGRGFTLIEIMIVVAILGVVLSIAAFTWISQRGLAQQRVCQENQLKVEGAKEQWALENNRPGDSEVSWDDLVDESGTLYLKREVSCPARGTYTLGQVGDDVTCTVDVPYDHNATMNSTD